MELTDFSFALIDNKAQVRCPQRNLNMGPSRIDVFDDCKATTLTTKPIWLVTFFSCFSSLLFRFPLLCFKTRQMSQIMQKYQFLPTNKVQRVRAKHQLAGQNTQHIFQAITKIYFCLAGWLGLGSFCGKRRECQLGQQH